MRKFRAAVIGTGFIGKVHIETIRRLGNVDVVAICDKANAKESAEVLCVPQYFDDYKKMIDTCNLDMVHICTPNNMHFPIVMYALEHGVNVVCEKPLTISVENAVTMVNKVKETGLTAAINFHNRFYPMTNHLKNLVADGYLGDVFSISGTYAQDWLLYKTDYSWRLESKESGNTRVIADIGSHWMDLVEFVSGQKIVSVCADFSTIHPIRKKPKKQVLAFSTEKFTDADYTDIPIDTEDNASVMFKFSGGAKGTAFFSQVIAGKSVDIDVLFGGYKRSAEWHAERCNDLIIGNRDAAKEYLEKGPATIHPKSAACVNYPLGHQEGFTDAFKNCFREAYASIDDKSRKYDYATFEDGLHEMILCQRIFDSNRKQGWVDVESTGSLL